MSHSPGTITRAQGVLLWVVGIPLVHVVTPVRLARTGRGARSRRARSRSHWNRIGLVPLAAGSALIGWACATHYGAGDEGFAIQMTPDYLLSGGPYEYSRNPIYAGEALMWLGWAVLLRSARVATGLVVMVSGMNVAIRIEERGLERRFGDSYREYLATVPRWFASGVR